MPPRACWVRSAGQPSNGRTTRGELREALDRLRDAGVNILGSADHTVTRSLHIEDQDGNEIEQHIDAQPERWREDPELVVVQPMRRP
jgi:catechol-2,3-dioxygenase